MTENLEQNSQSENTLPEPNAVTIMPLAQQYTARVTLDQKELADTCDKFWAERGEALAKTHYKGKKKKGGKVDLNKARKAIEGTMGKVQLYSEVLAPMFGAAIELEVPTERIMFVTALDLTDTDGLMTYYYWPKINMPTAVNFELERSTKGDVEEALEARCKMFQVQQCTYEPTEEVKPELQRVFVDIITSIDGKPSDAHSKRGIWLNVEELYPEEVKTEVLKSTKGDLVELNFMDEEQELNMHIKVYDVNNIIYLDLDDDALYIAEGHESKEDFVTKFKAQYAMNAEESDKGQAFTEVLNQILTSSTLGNIPNSWLASNTDQYVSRHVASQGGNMKKALASIGVSTEDEMVELFKSQVFKETAQQMAIFWYADTFDCAVDNLSVATDIFTKVTWI